MPSTTSRALLLRCAIPLAASALLLTGCASSGSGDAPKTGSLGHELDGATFTVGSKDFSESIILGYLTMDLLQAHGAKVDDKTNIHGSTNTREALTSGNIDMYWDYTGTGWITYLKHTTPVKDPLQQYQQVQAEDLAKNKIAWMDRAPLNNTYAFAVLQSKAASLNVRTLSDVSKLLTTNPSQATFCIESEFSTRDDGFPGMTKAYGMNVPKSNIKMLDTGVIYTETAKGTTCNFGEVFATDGRIAAEKLQVMTDDQGFFPVYNAALTMREETKQKYPMIEGFFAPVAAKLTTETMQQLNAQVDVQGLDAKQVAHDWLKQNGFISS